MWESAAGRLALLELLCRGTLRRRRAQEQVFTHLAELPWTRASGRRDELAIVAERRRDLVTLLDRAWPEWRDELAALTERGLAPTPQGFAQLLDARRAEGLGDLPSRLNRRTAASLAAPHSKASLTLARRDSLGDVATTHDGTIRLRPPPGLVARTERGMLDLEAIAAVLGEVAIPERPFLDGLRLQGPLRAVVLVENLGAFCDMPAPPGWLLAHVAGWDTATVVGLFETVAHVPVVHFGDLDANGLRIYRHLCARRPDLRWFVPEFWAEFVERRARQGIWPDELDLAGVPPLVRDLAARGLWLEQEGIVLDPRLTGALVACVATDG